MKKSQVGMMGVEIVILIVSICALFFVILVAISHQEYKKEAGYLEKYFKIKLPDNYTRFTIKDIAGVRPAIERRLKELNDNYNSASDEFQKNPLIGKDATDAFNNLTTAKETLEEACEAAKYFYLVSEDCEPCKAVK